MKRVLIILMLLLVGGSALSRREGQTISGPKASYRLLFVRGADVWLANGDGMGQRRVLHNANSPCWAANRRKVGFARGNEIWIADVDGSHAQRVYKSTAKGFQRFEGISWDSKDNALMFGCVEEVTFALSPKRKVTLETSSLLSVPLSGKDSKTSASVVFDMSEQGSSFAFSHQDTPAWSPSGLELAFARNGDIWLLERFDRQNSSRDWSAWHWDTTRLMDTAEFDDTNARGSRSNTGVNRFSWSPDGMTLAYSTTRRNGTGYGEVGLLKLVKNQDGAKEMKTNACIVGMAVNPSFSPDGKFVAYTDLQSHSIWVTSLDGKQKRKLISNADEPCW